LFLVVTKPRLLLEDSDRCHHDFEDLLFLYDLTLLYPLSSFAIFSSSASLAIADAELSLIDLGQSYLLLKRLLQH
jgi:hypothetical protein